MAIDTTVTARDRKLIAVAGTFVVIVVTVWALILPAWDAHGSLTDEQASLSAQVAQASEPALVDGLNTSTSNYHAQTASQLAGFYPVMTTAQVGDLMTSIMTGYQATIMDVRIVPGSGNAAATTFAAARPDTSSNTASSATSSAQKIDVTKLATPDQGDLTGIYETDVQVSLAGDRATLQGFVNDMASAAYPGIRVKGFQWTERTRTNAADTSGDWEVTCVLALYSFDQ